MQLGSYSSVDMNIKSVLKAFYVLAILLTPTQALAETLVLIHGYLGGAADWHHSGITRLLVEAGWADAGQLSLRPQGVHVSRSKGRGANRFFTLDLPSQAPLLLQSRRLDQYLGHIRMRHPGTALILVGHSAGGVLARLYMVQHPDAGVIALTTIASPHRGTETAELGLLAGQSPLAWLGPIIGIDTLNRSQGLYHDLMRERPNNLLGWLNYQRHPPAMYISIVRGEDNETFGFGELIVPTWSQDMNQVYALRGRAQTVTVRGGHALKLDDGKVLVKILESLQRI